VSGFKRGEKIRRGLRKNKEQALSKFNQERGIDCIGGKQWKRCQRGERVRRIILRKKLGNKEIYRIKRKEYKEKS